MGGNEKKHNNRSTKPMKKNEKKIKKNVLKIVDFVEKWVDAARNVDGLEERSLKKSWTQWTKKVDDWREMKNCKKI